MLNKKQSQQFLDAYTDRYGIEWMSTEERSEIVIHKWIEAEPHVEYQFFVDLCKKILGKKAKKTYKQRAWWRETNLHKLVNSLWLNYWPRCLDKNWEVLIHKPFIDDIHL